MKAPSTLTLLLTLWTSIRALAWDYEGHRFINQLALASLPANFPAFALTPEARERVAFLAGEPDRWRNSPDLPFKHCNAPDHYLDLDDLPELGMDPRRLSPFRYEFTAHLAVARSGRPDPVPRIEPARDTDRTRALVGFLPWTITEYFGKLKSGFSYLKALQDGGTPEEVANAQQNIVYVMGVMGHFVGDGSQPLHTTKHFNGWVGANPNRYATNRTFHSWVDGGYINKTGLDPKPLLARLRPAQLVTGAGANGPTNLFPVIMEYLLEQHQLVETLYRLDKEYKLPGKTGVHPEGYAFITGQMLKAGQLLGDLWYTAWQQAPPDTYLKSALAKRKLKESATQ